VVTVVDTQRLELRQMVLLELLTQAVAVAVRILVVALVRLVVLAVLAS
jgi:hypothetical protein